MKTLAQINDHNLRIFLRSHELKVYL